MAIHPSGKYLYVVNQAARTISQYSVGSRGALSPLGTPTVSVPVTGTPNDIDIDPSGRFAYVASSNKVVAQFAIGSNGALTAMTPSSIALDTIAAAAAVTPSGSSLYVISANTDGVSQYGIGDNGAISALPLTTVPTGSSPQAIAVDPLGKYAFVANVDSADISQYTISPATGALTPSNPTSVSAGTANTDSPCSIAVDPSGKYEYVVDSRGATSRVWQYTIDTSGVLAPMASAFVATGAYGRTITVSAAYR